MKPVFVSIAVVLAVGYFAWRVFYLLKLLSLGKSENRFDRIGTRFWSMVKLSIFQASQFRVPHKDYTFAGVMHIMIIFGFFLLLPGEMEFVLGGIIPGFDLSFVGPRLFGLFLLSQDIFIFLVIVAMAMAFFRRFILKPPQINYHLSAYLILVCICLLMFTLLGINALRLVDPAESHFAGFAARWMPFTRIFVQLSGLNGIHPVLFEVMWWLHLLVLLFFLDYIPNSKHLHILGGIPANFFRNLPPPLVKLSKIDFDAEELASLGVSKVEDLTWKQLFDGYTCTECGRCTDQCPANATGKELSPKEIILSIKENLFANARMLLKTPREKWDESDRVTLLGDSIPEKVLWQCTTCGACANVCPVGNEHLRAILEMRRFQMMEEGKTTDLMGKAVKSLEARSHPFFGAVSGPNDWKKGLDIPFFEKGKTEYLLWIGCAITYEERSQNIGRAMVDVLEKAGVSFGILKNSRCSGDPAKQMGNEFLFSELATQNIEDFSGLGVKKILTMCPHCFNSFVRHYPEFGGTYEVIPHAVFIESLIKSGKLNLAKSDNSITYHDPCYLARHNDILAEPRKVLDGIGAIREMPRHGKASFCCGGGGGNYWAEEEGTRINQARAKEAFDCGTEKIATACPFCLSMLTDGLKKYTEETRVFDIAELVSMFSK